MRRILLVVLVAVTAALFTPGGSAVAATSYPTGKIGAPCSGKWNKFGDVDPAVHPIYGSGFDWSTDFYCSTGSALKVHLTTSHARHFKFKVTRISAASCGATAGGWTVSVDAYSYPNGSSSGTLVASLTFSHVSRPKDYIKVGNTYASGSQIGVSKRFAGGACYQVSNDSGVHTHIEVNNRSNASCYIQRAANSSVSYGTMIGKIGGSFASSAKSRCP